MYKSGFFNSQNGDRKYNSQDINDFLKGILSKDGVFENVDNKLQVIPGDGMAVGIDTGKALVSYFHFKNDAIEAVALDESDLTLNRYDAIVLRYDIGLRKITPVVIKGTNATTPVKPNIVRNTSYYDLCLAYVYIAAGATSITQSVITDTRLDSDVCGYITGLITQVDTSQLFDQWQSACEELFAEFTTWKNTQEASFEAWFESLTETLGVTTYIQEYKNVQTTDASITELLIGIPEFDSSADTLFVTNYGLMLVENEDYTVSGTGSAAKLVFTGTIIPNQKIECRVLKSKIGIRQS